MECFSVISGCTHRIFKTFICYILIMLHLFRKHRYETITCLFVCSVANWQKLFVSEDCHRLVGGHDCSLLGYVPPNLMEKF